MGMKLKTCSDCRKRKWIGKSKRRCKECRRHNKIKDHIESECIRLGYGERDTDGNFRLKEKGDGSRD